MIEMEQPYASIGPVVVNRPPKITWYRMDMNGTSVSIPALPSSTSDAITLTLPVGVSVLDADVSGENTGTASAGTTASAAAAAGAGATADAVDTARPTAQESGLGAAATEWIAAIAARHLVVRIPDDAQLQEALVVRIAATPDAVAAVTLSVLAGAHSHAKVVVEVDSPDAGTSGATASLVHIHATAGAHVELQQLQTLGDTWLHLDEVGISLDADAHVKVSQTVLGAGETYMGLIADLVGDRSSCEVDTRYLGHGANAIDFNYVMRQRGRATKATLAANGVLTGTSNKTLRGTIDLVHGCKGSTGRESENVLLADEKVRNKTLPVILCDEDDVSGEHGATIGHVNRDQLEYMASRGLDVERIEALFSSATFDYAIDHAHDTVSQAAIRRLAGDVLGEDAKVLEVSEA